MRYSCGLPLRSAERLAFPQIRQLLSRLRLESGGVASPKLRSRAGKASLTALGGGKPHRGSIVVPRFRL